MEKLRANLTDEGMVSFECKVVGFPTPVLTWLKDGKDLRPGDVYQLYGNQSIGVYTCVARNCMGEARFVHHLETLYLLSSQQYTTKQEMMLIQLSH